MFQLYFAWFSKGFSHPSVIGSKELATYTLIRSAWIIGEEKMRREKGKKMSAYLPLHNTMSHNNNCSTNFVDQNIIKDDTVEYFWKTISDPPPLHTPIPNSSTAALHENSSDGSRFDRPQTHCCRWPPAAAGSVAKTTARGPACCCTVVAVVGSDGAAAGSCAVAWAAADAVAVGGAGGWRSAADATVAVPSAPYPSAATRGCRPQSRESAGSTICIFDRIRAFFPTIFKRAKPSFNNNK